MPSDSKFKFYYVDPPLFEGEAEGEDQRVWFTSREVATRCFNDWVRRIKKRDKQVRDADGESAKSIELDEEFSHPFVYLGECFITPTKQGLLYGLNGKFRGHKLREYPEPEERFTQKLVRERKE